MALHVLNRAALVSAARFQSVAPSWAAEKQRNEYPKDRRACEIHWFAAPDGIAQRSCILSLAWSCSNTTTCRLVKRPDSF